MRRRIAKKIIKRVGWLRFEWQGIQGRSVAFVELFQVKSYRLSTLQRAWQSVKFAGKAQFRWSIRKEPNDDMPALWWQKYRMLDGD